MLNLQSENKTMLSFFNIANKCPKNKTIIILFIRLDSSTARCEISSSDNIAIVHGSIIADVAVLLIHNEKNQVGNITESISLII